MIKVHIISCSTLATCAIDRFVVHKSSRVCLANATVVRKHNNCRYDWCIILILSKQIYVLSVYSTAALALNIFLCLLITIVQLTIQLSDWFSIELRHWYSANVSIGERISDNTNLYSLPGGFPKNRFFEIHRFNCAFLAPDNMIDRAILHDQLLFPFRQG